MFKILVTLILALFFLNTHAQSFETVEAEPEGQAPTEIIKVAEKKERQGTQLLSEINLQGLKWEDFGVSKGVYFTDALAKSWVNYLLKQKTKNTVLISPCLSSCPSFFQWMETLKTEEVPSFDQGKWIKISVNLSLMKADLENREFLYAWEGSAVLLDMQSKRMIDSLTIEKEEKLIKGKTANDMNSILASSIYQSGLKALIQFSSHLSHTTHESQKVREVVVTGYQQMTDLLKLIKEIGNRGVFAELEFFKVHEAKIKCYFSGEEKKFKDTLAAIKELKFKSHYKVINDHQGRNYKMRLITQ